MPNPSTVEAGLPESKQELLEELRRSFKRLERHSRNMAREVGHIENVSAKLGIKIDFRFHGESQ